MAQRLCTLSCFQYTAQVPTSALVMPKPAPDAGLLQNSEKGKQGLGAGEKLLKGERMPIRKHLQGSWRSWDSCDRKRFIFISPSEVQLHKKKVVKKLDLCFLYQTEVPFLLNNTQKACSFFVWGGQIILQEHKTTAFAAALMEGTLTTAQHMHCCPVWGLVRWEGCRHPQDTACTYQYSTGLTSGPLGLFSSHDQVSRPHWWWTGPT